MLKEIFPSGDDSSVGGKEFAKFPSNQKALGHIECMQHA